MRYSNLGTMGYAPEIYLTYTVATVAIHISMPRGTSTNVCVIDDAILYRWLP